MKLPITSRQAQFLNELKMVAGDYRKSCKQVSDQALADIENLDKGFNYTGPSHQRIFELQVNHGKLAATLQQTYTVFDFSKLSDEDRRASYANVTEWVALACGPESETFDLYFQSIDE
jgi:hypothetical protein